MNSLQTLENGNQKCLIRRLSREYSDLLPNYVSIDIEKEDKGDTIFTIQDKKNTTYRIQMSNTYPFVPPKVFVNNKPYLNYLCIHQPLFNKTLRSINGNKCLCCSSMILRQNWTPAYTLKHVLKEVDENRLLKCRIVWKLLADKIKDTYLIADIDLDSWLFPIPK
jgi:ubiquitin-protein ligase